jgi:2-keto-4-pentenoate hydratase/2-oxohepta-3-ene-1,7-dioic acid hydratase in catechol pathway
MKLVTFDAGQGPRLGALVDDQIIDLSAASQGSLPGNMRALLEMGQSGLDSVKQALDGSTAGATYTAGAVKLMAPILNPSKVIAIGLNYMDHCREQKIDPPELPIIFTKFPTSIIGPGDTIRWDPALTGQVDYEVELGVIIGKTARRVSAADAYDYVAGYTVCNDVSARDLQFGDGQWVRGKSLDTFCPLGPWLVTKDEVPDPQKLSIRCMVNDQVLQDSNTAEMIFQIPTLIEFASRAFTLLPGDVLITGTPDGVGVFRDPKVFLKDGDLVTVEVEGLGQLANPCREEGR